MSTNKEFVDSTTFRCRIISVTPISYPDTLAGGPVSGLNHQGTYTTTSLGSALYFLVIPPSGFLGNFVIDIPGNGFNRLGSYLCKEDGKRYDVTFAKADDNPYIEVKQLHYRVTTTHTFSSNESYDMYYQIPILVVPPKQIPIQ